MTNLSARYAKVKKLVGGNREVTGFEYTFGMSKEELQHITPVNRWIRRILSETEFAIRLSAENNHQWDDNISAALTVLEKGLKAEGVITKSTVDEAERELAPMAKAAKEYKLILAAHAHIDMNWMWGWHETVAATLATFRTMLNLMDEYPDFCYSQSQASVYKIVEDFDPEMMKQIKQRIKEGRWEITATAWVETDKNMPNTESLLRHIKYTRDYLKEHWGVDPASLEIDFSPDTFGHSANIPEIDSYGDVKYMYHCRGLDGDYALYRWRGLPLVDHELNYFAPGCYTTQSRIKLGNRRSEASLIDAEAFCSLAATYTGKRFMANQFVGAWQKVLFTHFHDILTGSCVRDSREHAMGLYSEAMAVANTQHNNAIRAIAEQIDTSMVPYDEDEEVIRASQSEGAGVGYGLLHFTGVPSPERGVGRTRVFHVFNFSANDREENTEITVWDWTGDMRFIRIEDVNGNPLDFELLDKTLQRYWDHQYFRFLVRIKVPALGYTTVVLKEEEPAEYPFYYHGKRTDDATENPILENEYLRAEFSCETGAMLSLIDKQDGTELIKEGEHGGLSVIFTEAASSNAWQIGKHLREQPVDNLIKFTPYEPSKLRQGFSMEAKVLGSTIKADVFLEPGSRALTYKVNVDWHEIGGEKVPVLVFKLPLAYQAQGYLCDIPAGSLIRDERNADIPGLQYISALKEQGNSVAIVTDSKYGYRGYDNELTATLINSATSPDPYPERGIHNVEISVAVAPANPKDLEVLATDLNHPLSYVSVNPHKGTLSPEQSFLRAFSDSAVVSAVSQTEGGCLLVRVYETSGKDTEVTIELATSVKSATFVDLAERELPGDIVIKEKTLKFKLKASCIAALKIRL